MAEVKVNKGNIKFTMFFDRDEERFVIHESSYELQKYFILEYDQDRAKTGIGNHLTVTMYTLVNVTVGTAGIGRGQRGIEVDTKELMALRNIVHFNCVNPFGCASCS